MTTMYPPRRPSARRALSVLSAAALALSGAVIAAPAQAAVDDVVPASGSLDWGYKASFRKYVGGPMNPLGAGGLQATDPATRSGPGATDGFLFPVASGTAADPDNLTIATVGAALFRFPSHSFEVRLSDLKVVVADGVASIVADTYLKADIDFGDIVAGTYEADDVRIAEAGTAQVSVVDGVVTVQATAVTLTAEGAAANPLYEAGAPLDDFALRAAVEQPGTSPGAGGADDIEVVVPESGGEPEPGTGSFGWEWAQTTPVTLGTAVETGGSFVADGMLNDITVTDTRSGGTGAYRWELTGSVSDFVGGAASFSSSHLGWTPKVSGAGTSVVAGPVARSLNTTAVLASSTSAASATVSAALSLALPTSTPAGKYAATVTITAVG